MLYLLDAVRDWWRETQGRRLAEQVAAAESALVLEKQKISATDSRVAAIKAEARLREAKAALYLAKSKLSGKGITEHKEGNHNGASERTKKG